MAELSPPEQQSSLAPAADRLLTTLAATGSGVAGGMVEEALHG